MTVRPPGPQSVLARREYSGVTRPGRARGTNMAPGPGPGFSSLSGHYKRWIILVPTLPHCHTYKL